MVVGECYMLEPEVVADAIINGIRKNRYMIIPGALSRFIVLLDRWFPALFEVRNLCGFTPELLWGISIAEGLLAIATVLATLALTALYAAIVSG